MRRPLLILAVMLASAYLSGCGYNKLQTQDESVKAAWSDVVNQYQRRADLIPNLVAIVKGYAAHEERCWSELPKRAPGPPRFSSRRSSSTTPQAFQQFQAAQGQLTQALKSLLVTVERYPDLKADQNFRDLQSQVEGTENRITVARNRYIDAVRDYNVTVR